MNILRFFKLDCLDVEFTIKRSELVYLKVNTYNKPPKLFVLCFPHLDTLDNWLPVVNKLEDLSIYRKKFT
jgi:hypothetical protein